MTSDKVVDSDDIDSDSSVLTTIRTTPSREKFAGQKRASRFRIQKWMSPEEERKLKTETHRPAESSHDRLVQTVVRLLPEGRDVVPISFLFSLLRCVLACNCSVENKSLLEFRIVSQLELGTISNLLYPFKITDEGCISWR